MTPPDRSLSGPGLSARATARHRALESRREDALFHDPLAQRLAGPDPGELERVPAFGARNTWSTAVRTAVFDELLSGLLERERPGLVLSLGAGLDARPYRLELPPELRWVEADLPEVVAYKEELLRGREPCCRVERVGLDLSDRVARMDLLRRVAEAPGKGLVLTEGVLIYLAEDQVAALARELRATRALRWWLTEVATPPVLRTARRRGLHGSEHPELRFRFAPEEGAGFFRSLGWTVREARPFLDEALRLGRAPGPRWLWRLGLRLVPGLKERYRSLASIVLLERADPSGPDEGLDRRGLPWTG